MVRCTLCHLCLIRDETSRCHCPCCSSHTGEGGIKRQGGRRRKGRDEIEQKLSPARLCASTQTHTHTQTHTDTHRAAHKQTLISATYSSFKRARHASPDRGPALTLIKGMAASVFFVAASTISLRFVCCCVSVCLFVCLSVCLLFHFAVQKRKALCSSHQ